MEIKVYGPGCAKCKTTQAVVEKVIADKYEIASSSLIVVKDGKVDNLTSMGFQYARNNPEQFK